MRILGHRIIGIPFAITFLITVIFFWIIFNYFAIEINQNMTIAILGIALMSGGFVSMWRKGILHQGHFSLVVGLIFVIVAGIMTVGAFNIPYKNDQGQIIVVNKLWDLTPQEVGIFLLLGIVGILSFVSGLKQMFGAGYFWGMKRK